MPRSIWFLLLIAAASAQPVPTRTKVDLPKPSGPYAIGRVSYDWVDAARPETLAKDRNTHREIVVDVWYPAAPLRAGELAAPYLVDAAKIDTSSYANLEKHWYKETWPMVISGAIQTHTYEKAPFVAGNKRFPLLIFSPGYSVEPLAYTIQVEDLVSHGYAVATIHHTYEVAVTLFSDGRMIPFSVENSRGQDAPTREAYAAWEKSRVDVWAADIHFVLDQIARLNADPAQGAPFAGRIDTRQVGALGHSFGGLAAARACGLDPRLQACLNQDGVGNDGSIPHYGEGHMPAHPYMYMTAMRGSGYEMKSKDGQEQHAQMEKELKDCLAGAYEVGIGTSGFTHMWFADFAWLQAGTPEEAAKALKSLGMIEAYTNAFFDKFLKGAQDTLLDRQPANTNEVTIQYYSQPSLSGS